MRGADRVQLADTGVTGIRPAPCQSSTVRSAPVMYDEASEARKATTLKRTSACRPASAERR